MDVDRGHRKRSELQPIDPRDTAAIDLQDGCSRASFSSSACLTGNPSWEVVDHHDHGRQGHRGSIQNRTVALRDHENRCQEHQNNLAKAIDREITSQNHWLRVELWRPSLNYRFYVKNPMPAEIILQQTPDDAALAIKREQLKAVRIELAERESSLVQFRAQLKIFENLYFRQVGALYADLDDIEARIAEREVDLYDSDSARQRARESRQRARDSHDAAFVDSAQVVEVDPPTGIKTLFRELAKRIHPDFARDAVEGKHFTLLMARANQAYRRGDIEVLQRLLDDQREILELMEEKAGVAELRRINRQIQHAHRDMDTLDAERHALLTSEVGRMYLEAETATRENRDLLAELAASLNEQIAEAQSRFAFVDRQITAHGR